MEMALEERWEWYPNNQGLKWDLGTECVLTTVSDVEKPIVILLVFIYGRHNCTCKQREQLKNGPC
jgi:hypothetical protein